MAISQKAIYKFLLLLPEDKLDSFKQKDVVAISNFSKPYVSELCKKASELGYISLVKQSYKLSQKGNATLLELNKVKKEKLSALLKGISYSSAEKFALDLAIEQVDHKQSI